MKLTFKPEDFKPVDGNVLIQPGPVKMIKTLQASLENAKYDAKGEKALVEHTYGKEPTRLRIGQVIAISSKISHDVQFKEGDWVVYNTQRGYNMKLDLLAKKSDDDKCPILMQRHEIVATLNNINNG